MRTSLIIALLLLGHPDGVTIEQTITCHSTPCPSPPPCAPCPYPRPVDGEALPSVLVLTAEAAEPKPWFHLFTYARLLRFLGNNEKWNTYSRAYYRSLPYAVKGGRTYGYLGNVLWGPLVHGLYGYCLNPEAPYLWESCTVNRTVPVRLWIRPPPTHPFDRDVNGQIGKVDVAHFIRCWRGLDGPGDWCEGTVGIPPVDK